MLYEAKPVDENEQIIQPPSCRLMAQGSYIDGVIYGVKKMQYDPGMGHQSSPHSKLVVQLLVVARQGSVEIGPEVQPVPVEARDTISCWIRGRRIKQWDAAVRALGTGGVEPGTLMRWALIRLTDLGNGKQSKEFAYSLSPRPVDEAWRSWVQVADQYHQLVQEAETAAMSPTPPVASQPPAPQAQPPADLPNLLSGPLHEAPSEAPQVGF